MGRGGRRPGAGAPHGEKNGNWKGGKYSLERRRRLWPVLPDHPPELFVRCRAQTAAVIAELKRLRVAKYGNG